jgi:hypothetical protein
MTARKFIGVFLLGALAMVLTVLFYWLPKAVLTWIFPNDYVYRFTVSVTLDGKTYTGETVSACRVQSSSVADVLKARFGHYWNWRLWATPLNVALPDGRFLLLPPRAYCGETPERPDPLWKWRLGLLPPWGADEAPFDPFRRSRPVLFDGAVAPKQGTVLLTRAGAESLGLQLSSIIVRPATWREVEDHLDRKPGAPWLAPVVEQCVRTRSPTCRIHEARGYKALPLTLAEAMEVPAFAAWAKQADRSQPVTGVPDRGLAIRLHDEFRHKKPVVAMTPDWSAGRWIATEQQGLAHVVFPPDWPGDLSAPILCFTADRCVKRFAGFAAVDWDAGRVIVADGENLFGRIVFSGESDPGRHYQLGVTFSAREWRR